MKRRRAVVVGFEYYARYLSQLMNEHSQGWEFRAFSNTRAGTVRALLAMRKADALISFGGPGPSVALSEAAQALRIPVIVIWAGSDVITAAASPFELAVVKRQGYNNVSDGPWLVDELHALGIEAKYLPVTAVRAEDPIAPLPERFRVLTYLPEPRRAFYGESRVYAIARAMRDVEFAVIGAGPRNPNAPRNVKFLGYVGNVPVQIDASTVLLRLPDHDGKSMLVLETLARGRHVVWTHEFPGVRAAATTDDALVALHDLHECHRLARLRVNESGRAYVRERFERSTIAGAFEEHLNHVTGSRQEASKVRKYRAAISGLGLFSADFASQVERLHPDWEVRVLRTGSRLEVASSLLYLVASDVWYSIGSPVTDRWVNLAARLMRKPRVVHWVGSDIEHFRNTASLRGSLRSRSVRHLTEIWWTADELAGLGLKSEIAPLPLRQHATGVKPLPDRFTIMLYLPKGRPEFYGSSEYETLLRGWQGEAPRIFVVGGGDVRAPAGIEVVNLGWQDDLRGVYEQSTVLVRLTARDGLSLMVLEALSFGRHVFWSKPFPYTTHVKRPDDLRSGLHALYEQHCTGHLHAQYAAAEMVRRRYATEATVDGILRTWEAALA